MSRTLRTQRRRGAAWRRTLGPALAVMATAWCAGAAHAQAVLELDRDGYLSRVDSDARVLLADPERRAAATAAIVVARRRPYPTLTAGISQLDVSGQGAPTSGSVGLEVPFELGGDRRARVEEAEAELALTAAELEAEARTLRIAASIAFVDALAARAAVDTRRALLAGHERIAALDAMRLERAEITEASALRTALERDRAALELASAERELEAVERTLGGFLLTEEPVRVRPTDALPATHPVHDEAALVEAALAHHPSVLAAQQRVAVARAVRARVRANRVVDPSVHVQWTHNASTSEPQFRQRANDTLALLLAVPLPLNAPGRAALALADAELAAAEARLEGLRHRLAAELRTALGAEATARARVEALDGTMRVRAEALVRATEDAYRRDAATAFELVSAQRTLEEVALAVVEAERALEQAHLAVEARAAGTP